MSRGLCSDLTLLVVTRGEVECLGLLAELAEDAAEIGAHLLVAADGDGAELGRRLAAVLREVMPGAEVFPVCSAGYIESVLDVALARVGTAYVFRVDDDESLPPRTLRWLADGGYRLAPHWKFARAHAWGDRDRFLPAMPIWPDHQTRLSLRELAGQRNVIHCGSPHGGGELAPVVLVHEKFLVKSLAVRRSIVERYDRIQPGMGTSFAAFSVPEDCSVSLTTLPLADAEQWAWAAALERWAALAVDRGFELGMFQHRGEIEPFARWVGSLRPFNVVEIGGLHGGTASVWHALCTGKVISVDLPGGRFGGADHGYDQARCEERNARLGETLPRFHGVLGDSHSELVVHQVRQLLGGEGCDLLFIDGDHTFDGVRGDYVAYRPFVNPSGVVAFHDVLDTPLHRAYGCEVDRLWRSLPGVRKTFSVDGPWGGIGALLREVA